MKENTHIYEPPLITVIELDSCDILTLSYDGNKDNTGNIPDEW